jgi:arylsulfatase A-like enzyme
MYIRLDKNIADLLSTLDAKVGAGNYLVFLSADHAVADVAQYLKDNKLPAGYFNYANAKASLNDYLKRYFPQKDIIEEIDWNSIYFNHSAFESNPQSSGVEMMVATELVINYLMTLDGISNVFSKNDLRSGDYTDGGIQGRFIRGYNATRGGDVVLSLESGWYGASRVQGTTHGSPYTYDTHVPVLFYGAGVKKGSSVKYHPITDIAPTLSIFLNLKFPSGCTGQPIEELFED